MYNIQRGELYMNITNFLSLMLKFALPGVLINDVISLLSIANKRKDNLRCSEIYVPYFTDNKPISKLKIDCERLNCLAKYLKILDDKLTDCEKRTLHENLQTLKVCKKNFFSLSFHDGLYIPKENKILVATIDSLGHELLHMSSTKVLPQDIYLIGYRYINRNANIDIGNGLNEGYTELLATRYFGCSTLPFENKENVQIARLLECFFDNPQYMRYLYFNHDLNGFIDYMTTFAEKEEVIQLLIEIDELNDLNKLITPLYLMKSRLIQEKLNEWFKSKVTERERINKFDAIYNAKSRKKNDKIKKTKKLLTQHKNNFV